MITAIFDRLLQWSKSLEITRTGTPAIKICHIKSVKLPRGLLALHEIRTRSMSLPASLGTHVDKTVIISHITALVPELIQPIRFKVDGHVIGLVSWKCPDRQTRLKKTIRFGLKAKNHACFFLPFCQFQLLKLMRKSLLVYVRLDHFVLILKILSSQASSYLKTLVIK